RVDRIARLHLPADDHWAEAVNLAELVLPGDQRFQFPLPTDVEAVDGVLADDHEQGEVDCVHAFAEDGTLPAALAERGVIDLDDALAEKAAGVLKVVAWHHAGQRLARLQRLAVAGIDVADLALRHRHKGDLVD